MSDAELHVELLHGYRPLDGFDMVLLPGSKTVIRDLQWLKQQSLFTELRKFERPIFGLPGSGNSQVFRYGCGACRYRAYFGGVIISI